MTLPSTATYAVAYVAVAAVLVVGVYDVWAVFNDTPGDTISHVIQMAYRLVPPLLAVVLTVFAVIGIWTPYVDPFVYDRWFDNMSTIWLLPRLTLFCAWRLWVSARLRYEGQPFVWTVAVFVFTYLSLLAAKWPYVVPPTYTLWEAASHPGSQLFLLIGVLFVTPIVLAYTTWTYWVFRGKVGADAGYH